MNERSPNALIDEAERLLADNPSPDNIRRAARLYKICIYNRRPTEIALKAGQGYLTCAKKIMEMPDHNKDYTSLAYCYQYLLAAALVTINQSSFGPNENYGTQQIVDPSDGTTKVIAMMHPEALDLRVKIVTELFNLAKKYSAETVSKNNKMATDCLLWAHRIIPKRKTGAAKEKIDELTTTHDAIIELYRILTKSTDNPNGVCIYKANGDQKPQEPRAQIANSTLVTHVANLTAACNC